MEPKKEKQNKTYQRIKLKTTNRESQITSSKNCHEKSYCIEKYFKTLYVGNFIAL